MSLRAILAGQDKHGDTINAIKEDTTKILDTLDDRKRAKRYGYRIKVTESNPATRVEYLYDAVGMTPAKMDFANSKFDYGSWQNIWFIRDNYPVMLNADGSEAYRLNPNDYTKKAADGTASEIETAATANAMSAIPLCWVKRYQEGDYQYVIFCETQYDEGYKAYAHTRKDGTIAPFVYHAIYEGCMENNKLRSLSGKRPQSQTAATAERTAAQANGTDWEISTWSLWNLIADLCTLISKTCNSQAAFGQGHTIGGTTATNLLDTGTLNNKGQFYGSSDTTSAVKVFHIENFWGDRWERCVGLTYNSGTFMVKMTPEGSGYNLTGAGYESTGLGINSANGNGYQVSTIQTPYGRFPQHPFTGSETTYEADFFWYNNSDVRVAILGGACNAGAVCGSRSLAVDNLASRAAWAFGASLVKI